MDNSAQNHKDEVISNSSKFSYSLFCAVSVDLALFSHVILCCSMLSYPVFYLLCQVTSVRIILCWDFWHITLFYAMFHYAMLFSVVLCAVVLIMFSKMLEKDLKTRARNNHCKNLDFQIRMKLFSWLLLIFYAQFCFNRNFLCKEW